MSTDKKGKVIVIIPAYNEDQNITKVINDIQHINASFDYDIVVINDGSADNTAAIVSSLGITIISHPINLGAGAAIQTGLKYASENNYKMAVIIDGDGQHPPQEIPKMVESMEMNSADVIIGSRFLEKYTGRIHWARRIGIFVFSFIVFLLSGEKITDTTSGLRLFNSRSIKYLSSEIPLDFPDADMLLSLIYAGFKIVEVPVVIKERKAGQSMYTLLRSTYYPFKITISIVAVLLRRIFVWRRK